MANKDRYFGIPFAEAGNKVEIPVLSTAGNVAYDTGFGPDYELPAGDPNRKRIERTGYNGVLNDVTKNLKQWQENNFPTWIQDIGDGTSYPYSEGVVVEHNAKNWLSKVDNNKTEPNPTNESWAEFELGGGGMFIPEIFVYGKEIPLGQVGDLITIGTKGKITQLTYLLGSVQEKGFTVDIDGNKVIDNKPLSGDGFRDASGFGVYKGAPSNLGAIVNIGGLEYLSGEIITISTTIKTTAVVRYSYATGSAS